MGMAIASLNINGLLSRLDEVKLLVKELGIHVFPLKRNEARS